LASIGGGGGTDVAGERRKVKRLQDVEIRGRIFRQEQNYKEFLLILAGGDLSAYRLLLDGTIDDVLVAYKRKAKENEKAEAELAQAKARNKRR
jgi:glycerol-3-phosphate dehydrogenase